MTSHASREAISPLRARMIEDMTIRGLQASLGLSRLQDEGGHGMSAGR